MSRTHIRQWRYNPIPSWDIGERVASTDSLPAEVSSLQFMLTSLAEAVSLYLALSLLAPSNIQAANINVPSPFTATLYASDLPGARTILVDSAGDLLVLVRTLDQIVLIFPKDPVATNAPSLVPETLRTVLVQAPSGVHFTHGLAMYKNFMYVSSDTTVYRWPYTPGKRTPILEGPDIVIRNMDTKGMGGAPEGHTTRTLIISPSGTLYVSIGSEGNVDQSSFRSRIRRLELGQDGMKALGPNGVDFQTMEVFADGLRNTVGLAFDSNGKLWGVENGADNLVVPSLGGDIHNDNPAEEVNVFDKAPGTFYGYPFCFTEYLLPEGIGTGRGSQWLWPSFANSNWTNEKCKDPTLNTPPVYSLPAHSAPLSIMFMDGNNYGCSNVSESRGEPSKTMGLPCNMAGDAFVALHGSWNRDVPYGYKVVRLDFTSAAGVPPFNIAPDPEDIFGADLSVCKSQNNCIRPVHVIRDPRTGGLFVSSDATGEIWWVGYDRTGSGPKTGSAGSVGILGADRAMGLCVALFLCYAMHLFAEL